MAVLALGLAPVLALELVPVLVLELVSVLVLELVTDSVQADVVVAWYPAATL